MNRIHKHTIEEIRAWRKAQHDQGKPDGLKDFFVAHGECPKCMGRGGWHHDKSLDYGQALKWIDCPDCNGTGEVRS